jgi:3-oxoacyl-[acyl-carrier protein] reductase
MLQNKNAVIYGAGGSLGSAVAKAFAKEGAKLFLTGRHITSVQKTADEIIALGGKAEVDVVDALNEEAIKRHLNKVGRVDISYNAMGIPVKQNVPLIDLSLEEYVNPITMTMQTNFLTATAAGRLMSKQGSGVILTLTATPGGIGYPYTAGFAAACVALENFTRNLASELGVHGVRVVNIRSGGSPDSRIFKEAIEKFPNEMKPVLGKMKEDTMLKDLPLMNDIANAAVFLASAMASKITGVTIDVTAGTTASLNYRVSSPDSLRTLPERE